MVGSQGFPASLNVAGLVSFWIFEEPWLICGLNESEGRARERRGVKYSEAGRSSLGTG
jgi:hypothetical protein